MEPETNSSRMRVRRKRKRKSTWSYIIYKQRNKRKFSLQHQRNDDLWHENEKWSTFYFAGRLNSRREEKNFISEIFLLEIFGDMYHSKEQMDKRKFRFNELICIKIDKAFYLGLLWDWRIISKFNFFLQKNAVNLKIYQNWDQELCLEGFQSTAGNQKFRMLSRDTVQVAKFLRAVRESQSLWSIICVAKLISLCCSSRVFPPLGRETIPAFVVS